MIKKVICAIVLSLILIGGSVAVWGMTHYGAIYTTSGFLGLTGNADVWFTAGRDIPTGNSGFVSGNNLVQGRVVRRCWTQLRRNNANTGEVRSSEATSRTDSTVRHAKASLTRNPTDWITMTYGWNYF